MDVLTTGSSRLIERCTFGVDVADGDPNIALRELRPDTPYKGVIVDQIDAIDRDQESVLPGFSESRSIIPSMNCMSSSASNGRGMDARTG